MHRTTYGLTAEQAMKREIVKLKKEYANCFTVEGNEKDFCRYSPKWIIEEIEKYEWAIKKLKLIKEGKI
jgi:hypothetical protein